ncbi:hypothetical protein GCM10009850_028240 [Nonomuraea monospora]|uniref:Immunity protein 35 domain-containing protein n=1 Tax=Nonomuraea monospora TaxID=568818 RepID=A0ABN3CE34_9ACTN
MIDEDEAGQIAREFVRRLSPEYGDDRLVLNEAATIEKPYGWLFTYTTAAYLRTHDQEYALIGAGPVLVLRESGRVIDFPSYRSQESVLKAYEEELDTGSD